MAEWFFEIRSGEIPGPMQRQAAADLERIVTNALTDLGLTFTSCRGFVGPRRLGAVIQGLPTEIAAQTDERRGPRVDAPEKAIDGFLKSTGLSLDDLEVRETPKGTFYFAALTTPAKATQDCLPEIIRQVIYTLPWPKSMTWSTTSRTWVRPLHGGCCLFDGKAVPFSVSMNEDGHEAPFLVTFDDVTVGHRYMAPSPFKVKSYDDYVGKLRKAFVIVDQDERKALIEQQIETVCQNHNLTVKSDKGLLDEVTGLVEWPTCLVGRIEDRFMALPPEVLRTTMRVHQRYFATHDATGAFAPHFIVVANIDAPDEGHQIVTGNERVLKARLSDAMFFYENDKQNKLADRVERLSNTVFHADLGTMGEKQDRLKTIINSIAADQDGNARDAALQAAGLCKADLMTEMVYEFPELQGVMGSYYATADGYDEAVSQAIYHQYSPKGPDDALPAEKAAQILALADRLDTLVGFFRIGLKPTGSKDPFALRRAALGIVRYLEASSSSFMVTLDECFATAFAGYDAIVAADKSCPKDEVMADLRAFLQDRLKVYWRDQGIAHDFVSCVLDQVTSEPLRIVKQRLETLVAFTNQDPKQSENLFSGYKRAVNILKKESTDLPGDLPQEALFELAEEKTLFGELTTVKTAMTRALDGNDYQSALESLAPLRPHVDAFFDHVQVNDDRASVRENRLKLLAYIRRTFEQYADFSKL